MVEERGLTRLGLAGQGSQPEPAEDVVPGSAEHPAGEHGLAERGLEARGFPEHRGLEDPRAADPGLQGPGREDARPDPRPEDPGLEDRALTSDGPAGHVRGEHAAAEPGPPLQGAADRSREVDRPRRGGLPVEQSAVEDRGREWPAVAAPERATTGPAGDGATGGGHHAQPGPVGRVGEADPAAQGETPPARSERSRVGLVLVVPGRPRYHVDGCRYLTGRDVGELSVADARAEGFTPCGVCKPDAALLTRRPARSGPQGSAVPVGEQGQVPVPGPGQIPVGGSRQVELQPTEPAGRGAGLVSGALAAGAAAAGAIAAAATPSARPAPPDADSGAPAPVDTPRDRSAGALSAGAPSGDALSGDASSGDALLGDASSSGGPAVPPVAGLARRLFGRMAPSPEATEAPGPAGTPSGAAPDEPRNAHAVPEAAVPAPDPGAAVPAPEPGPAVPAPDPGSAQPETALVLVVPDRGRYHRLECRYARGAPGATQVSREQARSEGYDACGVCKP